MANKHHTQTRTEPRRHSKESRNDVQDLLKRFAFVPLLLLTALLARYLLSPTPTTLTETVIPAPVLPNMAHQYSLPKLPYAYNALEPHISEQIMTLHHSKHHQTYVTNLNNALSSYTSALSTGNVPAQISLQQAIKFNGGGHINHSLFWANLCPASSPDATLAAAPKLGDAIKRTWGGEAQFKEAFETALLGIQGSGWGWLVKVENHTGERGRLAIVTTKDQDPVVGKGEVPVLGVDMWEHAYYLQYQNGKAAYVKNIWNIINWRTAEKRYLGGQDESWSVLKASM
ncbi:hypothetical protein P152DRAFT_462247 [Eremomyces bilateralis CBS 781.70]|uniref:Superoxide dismutase [Mn], mitochondrial n=1 Tax=Eremomyces bilateralis CBS 781.70 TaxID=1392243 RepID=A0A6G1FSD7_9PEZI|nr:uncharacterized protein P152DRAFT_462247 [Eremomyces bilateralis CBS 781.70]KAF1808683.1 hypothetical protein P152DRAFT_462247 [Eremomyces bilateralis CBS 781.70]